MLLSSAGTAVKSRIGRFPGAQRKSLADRLEAQEEERQHMLEQLEARPAPATEWAVHGRRETQCMNQMQFR